MSEPNDPIDASSVDEHEETRSEATRDVEADARYAFTLRRELQNDWIDLLPSDLKHKKAVKKRLKALKFEAKAAELEKSEAATEDPEVAAFIQQGQRDHDRSRQQRDGRPVIEIDHQIEVMTNKASDALQGDDHLFTQDSVLVHVSRVTIEEVESSKLVQTEDGPRRELVEGTPRIHPISSATLKSRLSELAQWWKFDGRSNQLKRARPDKDVVAALMDRKKYPSVRPLLGISEVPFLRPDGSICQEVGYDAATARLYLPSTEFPRVPEHPTRADASLELTRLIDVFADFPHEKPSHKIVPIAHAMTLLARPAIDGCTPAFAYDANTPGSGKGLQTDAIAIIATGRETPRMTFPFRIDEQEKVLGGLALDGSPLVCFDNLSVGLPFGGAPLEGAITTVGSKKFRILGESKTPELPWLTVVSATGNNLTYTADMCRRCLVSRLESLDVNPEQRTGFGHPNLLKHVHEHRAELVIALLTILRAFVLAGRPKMIDNSWGGLEPWTELIANSIMFAGGANVLDARVTADAAASRQDSAMVEFLTIMARNPFTLGGREYGAMGDEFSSGELFETFFAFGVKPVGETALALRAAIEGVCGGPVKNSRAIGTALAGYRRRVFRCSFSSAESSEIVQAHLMIDSRRVHGSERWRIAEPRHEEAP